MFNNPGGKLKIVAKVFFVLVVLASICMFNYQCEAEGEVGIGVACFLGGLVIAYSTGLLIFGFGQLIENTDPNAKDDIKTKTDAKTERKPKDDAKTAKESRV